jgi:nitrate reductase NapAB chaperone NapD
VLKLITGLYKDSEDTYDYMAVESLNKEMPKRLANLKNQLQKFDSLWATYEQDYIGELMVIETDARRFIMDAVEAESNLTFAEKAFQLTNIE